MADGDEFIVTAQLFEQNELSMKRFTINLHASNGAIPLHLRYDFQAPGQSEKIIMSSLSGGKWSAEKTSASPFNPGQHVEIHVKRIGNIYEITLTDGVVLTFPHRLTASEYPTIFTYQGDLKISKIQIMFHSEFSGQQQNMASFNKLRAVSQKFFGYQSILLNTYLLFLIHSRSPKQLGTYKYMMLYIAYFEMAYSVVDLITEPFMHSYRTTFAVLTDTNNSIFGNEFNLILIAFYGGFYGFSMAIFAVHFIFRYGITQSSIREKFFKGSLIAIWFLIPFVFGQVWMAVCLIYIPNRPQMSMFIRKTILDNYGLMMENIAYVGAYYYQTNDEGITYTDFDSFFGIGILFMEIISSMFCVLYFGILCYYKISNEMSEIAVMSRKMKTFQKQLFNALVVQTIIPVILMYIPVTVIFLFPALDVNFTLAANSCAVTISVYPAIDPLPTILIIDAYRKATFASLFWAPTIPSYRFLILSGCQNDQ
ncbi:unnamed protein product [Caenorhabditis bovis]|uniref:Galectin n=1 Tax=Caenorhabditis bovis TaxID=2654633 RepID=A0A8S1EYP5_9PELO|nr:unnamed protein product [Caenorhabditis bovis]